MPASRVLLRDVSVRHPETAVPHKFKAGEKPPAWAMKKLTNPALFEESAAVKQAKAKQEAAEEVERFGAGPFAERDRLQLLALARTISSLVDEVKDNTPKAELIAMLQAEGVSDGEES